MMARPREFDLDRALADAMNAFWAQGYEGTSLPDLLEAMNITRGSLYKAFTDKRTLFLKAMQRYEDNVVAQALAHLRSTDIKDGKDRIEQLFQSIADDVREGDHRGCMLCSAAAGPASYDPEIADLVSRILGTMKNGFEEALRDSSIKEDASRDDVIAFADLLITHYVGARILARSHASIDQLENSVNSVTRILHS